jgi:hypothetical protein
VRANFRSLAAAREKPSGVGKLQRLGTAVPWRARAKYLTKHD